jgi:hypothetical protein
LKYKYQYLPMVVLLLPCFHHSKGTNQDHQTTKPKFLSHNRGHITTIIESSSSYIHSSKFVCKTLTMAKASPTGSNAISTFEAIIGLLNCLILLAAAYVLLDRYLQNRQLQAAARAEGRYNNYLREISDGSRTAPDRELREAGARRSA